MLVFIGTLHCGLTSEDELIKIIESFNPTRLLIEITQDDIDSGKVEKYPPEMKATLAWALNKHIEVWGIDSTIKTLKANTTDEDLKKLDEEQTTITNKNDWKEFNKPELDGDLETKTWQKIVNKSKDRERNLEMYENIIRLTANSSSGTTIVITGSGHTPFFRSRFPKAQFPLSRS